MAVDVGGDLDGAVSHLLLHIHQRLALLEQEAGECVPEHMNNATPTPNPGFESIRNRGVCG